MHPSKYRSLEELVSGIKLLSTAPQQNTLVLLIIFLLLINKYF